MYPKNCQLASVQSTFTPQDGTDTDSANLSTHSATYHFATAKIPASQLGKHQALEPDVTNPLTVGIQPQPLERGKALTPAVISRRPIATRHHNPCGICGDTSGDCREIDIGYLCHSNLDGLAPAAGYLYRGLDQKQRVWGIWALDERRLSPPQRDSRRQELATLQALRQSNQRSLAANSLSADVRDYHYQKLLDELSLTPKDQAELLSRGLSLPEIEAHGYRSVAQWQRLSGDYPRSLPGIGRHGRSLNNYESGYLCPVRNVDGQIIGLQVRRRADGEGGRYRWLSNAQSAPVNLANGELPLSVFQADSAVLGFAEGTGPKPHIASLRLGIPIIGAAGGQWASSAEQLKVAVAHLQPKQFILYPDSGMTDNAGVMGRYRQLNEALSQLGHCLQVAWWSQTSKDDPDIDELTAEQRAGIELISWDEYAAKAIGESAPTTAQTAKQPTSERAAGALARQQAQTLAKWLPVAQELDPAFTPPSDTAEAIQAAKQLVLDTAEQKTEYHRIIPNTGATFADELLESSSRYTGPVVIGGATGGGKTEFATQLAAYIAERHPGLRYGAVAPTQVLSVQLAERFENKGLPMASTALIGKTEGAGKKPKALPAESLWRVKGQALDFIALDEPQQWLPRILSGILGDAADVNLSVLREIARSTPTQLWLNADPSPITVDLIAELSGQQPTVIDLQRQQEKKPVSIDFYSDSLGCNGQPILGAGLLYNHFIDSVRQGQRALLLAGSVKKARAIKKKLQREGHKVLLKDGKYTPKKQRLGFAMAPDKAMQHVDVVILTRLTETGLDVQKDFDAVYVALSPKMQARAAYQFLSRSRSLLRGDTPKLHIYSPSASFTAIEQLSVNYWEERIKRENRTYTSLLRGDTTQAQQKIDDLDWVIGYQARYSADRARQRYFRTELLQHKFDALGWKIERMLTPDEPHPIEAALKQEILRAARSEACCIARGHRSLNDYSEDYAQQLLDPNQQGLILGCKRRKLELSSLLPASDLEDVNLIFQLEQDERLLPQALLWSAIQMDPHSERIQRFIQLISSAHLDKFTTYGPLEGLKQLKKSKTVLALAIAEILSGDPCVERVLAGDDHISKAIPDVQALATKLAQHSDLLNVWCLRHYGREFEWSEDAVSTVCKALDKLLGIRSGAIGQETVRLKGKKVRVRNYRTAFSPAGQQAIAKKAKNYQQDSDKALDQVLADFIQRFGLMESAAAGWEARVNEAEMLMNQQLQALHTKGKTVDSIGLDFSVQANATGLMALSSPSLENPQNGPPPVLKDDLTHTGKGYWIEHSQETSTDGRSETSETARSELGKVLTDSG